MQADLSTIGIIAGIVLLLIGMFVYQQKKKTRMKFVWIGVVLAGIGLAVGFVPQLSEYNYLLFSGASTLSQVQTNPTVNVNQAPGACLSSDKTTVTLAGLDAYTGNAAGGTHRYRINGGAALTVADAGTFTASPGDQISILWENGTRTQSYASDNSVETVPCSGTATFKKQLYSNVTSWTATVYTTQGQVIDGGVTNQTVNTGDVLNIKTEIQGQYQKGAPHGFVVVAEYNKTEFDNVIVQMGGSQTNLPSFYALSSTANTAKAFTVPAVLSTDKITGNTVIDASDSNNPADGSDVKLTFYELNWYIDTANGGAFKLGVEDNSNTFTGLGSISKTIQIT